MRFNNQNGVLRTWDGETALGHPVLSISIGPKPLNSHQSIARDAEHHHFFDLTLEDARDLLFDIFDFFEDNYPEELPGYEAPIR